MYMALEGGRRMRMREEEETVEVDTEDEQSSRWEEETEDNRLDNTR